MTQKQLIDQFCEFRGKCTTEDVVALTYAYKSLQLDFINKACEWLEKNACLVYNFDGDENKYLFRNLFIILLFIIKTHQRSWKISAKQ